MIKVPIEREFYALSGKVKFLDNLLFVDCIIGIFIITPDGNCLKMFVSVDTSFVSPK